ncbi:MAG: hydroxymethylbilane synthase [Acidobacteria bacterium]|nr:hydroxymethylbilane synthase [Acidobacteriota bacterium]MBI3424893.1 hydroxymethylbilane synthase [Acidobacteriota bacterium]
MSTVIRIAARRSVLARLQAALVGAALQQAQPDLTINYQFRASLGDQRPDEPLWQMPEKGVFTEDLRAELLAGRCDLVVHSWKDLPIEEHPQTCLAATLPRADQRDLLLVNAKRWERVRAHGSFAVLTSSPRRAQNLRDLLPAALPASIRHLEFKPVRGSIQTRVEKLFTEDAAGLIIAKAALDRLLETDVVEFAESRDELRAALGQCHWMVLPLRWNPTAPGQGALALEARRADTDLLARLQAINCAETYAAVERERAILRAHGGGCHQAIGASVLQRPYGEITFVRGLRQDGEPLQTAALRPARPYPPKVGAQALWPLRREQNHWFVREALPVSEPPGQPPLWIAKDSALPADWVVPPTQLIWVSGWETWRKLAARGIWVNGSAEGLGEQENPRIAALPGRAPAWLKLTHAESDTAGGMKTLATYRLLPDAAAPTWQQFEQVEYCYWSSGSAFQRALELYPALRNRVHFCGPGASPATLRAAGVEPHICLDHEHWLGALAG